MFSLTIDKSLDHFLAAFQLHSDYYFEFAHAEYKLIGRGVLSLVFDNVHNALHAKKLPVTYMPLAVVEKGEYEPAIRYCQSYDPTTTFVCCVSISISKSLRQRQDFDALCKTMHLSKNAHTLVHGLGDFYRPQVHLTTATNQRVTTMGCAYCQKTGKLLTCSGCGFVKYCSTKCQRTGWATHKPLCREMKGDKRKLKRAMTSLSNKNK
jgi:hypothetical protein